MRLRPMARWTAEAQRNSARNPKRVGAAPSEETLSAASRIPAHTVVTIPVASASMPIRAIYSRGGAMSSRVETGRLSPADEVAVVDGSAEQRPGAGAENRAERLRSAGRDDVAQHAAGHTADDQPRGPIVAPAIVPVVRASVDPIVPAQATRTIPAIVADVVARRIPVASACIVAILPPIPSVLAAIPPIFPAVPAILPAIAPVFAAIPPVLAPVSAVFVAVPPILVLRRCGHRLKTHERTEQQCHRCRSDAVHLALPCDGHD